MNYLQDELLLERKVFVLCYYDQGFLGRMLVYCIDKLIQGCTASFELMKQERQLLLTSQSQSITESSNDSNTMRKSSIVPETIGAAAVTKIAVHDLNKIEQIKRVRMLRSVLQD